MVIKKNYLLNTQPRGQFERYGQKTSSLITKSHIHNFAQQYNNNNPNFQMQKSLILDLI